MVHPKAADLPEAHVARQAEAAHAHALERRHLQPRARRQLAHLQHTRSRRPSAPQLAAVSCSQLLPALTIGPLQDTGEDQRRPARFPQPW